MMLTCTSFKKCIYFRELFGNEDWESKVEAVKAITMLLQVSRRRTVTGVLYNTLSCLAYSLEYKEAVTI